MSSTNHTILDTVVLEVNTLHGPDHRKIQEIRIAYPGFQFRPGQFVMIKKNCGPTCWAYPYMIQNQTDRGFTVWAVGKSSLADARPGLPLTVWGANGRPVQAEGGTVVVCEAATWFLAAPIFNLIPGCRMLMLNPSGHTGDLGTRDGIAFASGISQLSEQLTRLLEGMGAPQITAALNISNLLALVNENRRLDTGMMRIFAGTKISCGVDGCKSCYLHSKDLPLGMSVCCNGPYLPFDKVDFEMDQRCFYTFD